MKYFWLLLLFTQVSFAADLPRLQALLKNNFTAFYAPRFCGQNIERLVRAADEKRIDLTNSYVVVLKSNAFWMLQGFGARGLKPNQRQSWSFHVILVADNHVFDFDFADQPRVLPFERYIKEMFIPKGPIDIPYDYKRDLPNVDLDFYETHNYLKNNARTSTTPKNSFKLKDLMDVTRL